MAKTYEAMMKSDSSHNTFKSTILSDWQFVDLKNQKQTSDLEKKLTHFRLKENSNVFNFASSKASEGVSTIVTNLARYMSLKKSNKKILLIDTNIVSPVIHKAFNISLEPGLTDVLATNGNISDVIHKPDGFNIDIIPCGDPQKIHSEGIEQEKFHTIIDTLKNQYDYIIIDSSPLISSVDSISVAQSSDVTFLIVQSLKVHKEVALRSKLLLEGNNCLIGGVILNRVNQVIPDWLYTIF